MLCIYRQLFVLSCIVMAGAAAQAMEGKWTLQELESMLLDNPITSMSADNEYGSKDADAIPVLDIDVEAIIEEYAPLKINPKLVIPGSKDFKEFIAALQIAKDMPVQPTQANVIGNLKAAITAATRASVKKQPLAAALPLAKSSGEQKQMVTGVMLDQLSDQLNQELMSAILAKDFARVHKAIQAGANVNYVTPYNSYPLLAALQVKNGHLEGDLVVQELLNSPTINFMLVTNEGYTPLIIAARLGHGDVIKDLVMKRKVTQISAKDRYGNTALHNAILTKQLEAIQVLVHLSASLTSVKNNGNRGAIAFARYLADSAPADSVDREVYSAIYSELQSYFTKREAFKQQKRDAQK